MHWTCHCVDRSIPATFERLSTNVDCSTLSDGGSGNKGDAETDGKLIKKPIKWPHKKPCKKVKKKQAVLEVSKAAPVESLGLPIL